MINYKVVFYLCLAIACILMVCGILSPPVGVIHNSVLIAVGILWAFGALALLPTLVENHEIEIKHGQTSVNIKDDDNN